MTSRHPHENPWYRLSYPIIKGWAMCVLFVLGPLKSVGRRNIPRKDGLLVICNHLSNLDPIIVQASSPRPLCFLSKKELFANPLASKIIRWFGAFPIDRDNPDRKALQQAAAFIKEGRMVLIFPEGRLSESGELLPIQPGFLLIARISGCPIITCRLKNTNVVMPYAKVIPKISFKRLEANWGELIPNEMAKYPDELLEKIRKELSPNQ